MCEKIYNNKFSDEFIFLMYCDSIFFVWKLIQNRIPGDLKQAEAKIDVCENAVKLEIFAG